MRRIRFLLIKEFKQMFRDPLILRIIFVVPAIQLLILPFAADYEIRHVYAGVVDHDHSPYSSRLVHKIEQSPYFDLVSTGSSYQHMLRQVEDGTVDLVVEIPARFESRLIRDNTADLMVTVNAVNGTKGNLGLLYMQQLLRQYNSDIREEWILWPRVSPFPQIDVEFHHWYNKEKNYQVFMVPGILAVLLTMVGSFLAAMNIVREKEIGTIEQLNVSPVRKHEFIIGKVIPFWILAFVILTIGLLISYLVFGIIPGRNIGLLYAFSGFYVFAILGIGLIISNFTYSQQQAMMVSFFFVAIFILMGGLYTPIESMPAWAQQIAWLNPVTYIVDAMRMILLKEAVLADLKDYFLKIGLSGLVLNILAIWSYRKRL